MSRGDRLCLALAGACRPCNDTEILMAICTSDFGECSPCPGAGSSQEGRKLKLGAEVPPGCPGLPCLGISTEAAAGWGWEQGWG